MLGFSMDSDWIVPLFALAIPIVAITGGIVVAVVRALGRQRMIELAQRERIAAIERGVDPSKLPPLDFGKLDVGSAFDSVPSLTHTIGFGIRILLPQLNKEVLRVDFGPKRPVRETVGAEAVADQAIMFGRGAPASDTTETVLINGTVGHVRFRGVQPFSLLAFTIAHGRIVEMDIIADAERLARLGLR